MFAGEEPHVPVVLTLFTKVGIELPNVSNILICNGFKRKGKKTLLNLDLGMIGVNIYPSK